MKQKIIDNIKTIFYALVIAIIIRSLLIQPFYIPSSSMEPTLLVGDRIFVTKYTYGYSKHSFPFSYGPIKKRIFFDEPERGDIIVFKTPADNRTDYIKRLIGGPGDKIQFIDGNLYLNNVEILKSKVKSEMKIYCGGEVLKTNLFDEPERGDIIVFKTPADNRTDYIKRLIGGPGDKIQFIDGNLYLNDVEILKSKVKSKMEIYCGGEVLETNLFEEKIENKKYLTAYNNFGSYRNSDEFVVPDNHYFFLGDNRDCSKDSRFLTSVGYVHRDNIVGKARFIFFSTDKKIGRFIEFWKWNKSFRLDRFFKKIK